MTPLSEAVSAPTLDSFATLDAGLYRLGEGPDERVVRLDAVLIGRWPVVNAHVREFVDATGWPADAALTARLREPLLDDHPITDMSFYDAVAFCDWAAGALGRPVRLPTADEWEAAARGADGRPWPWGVAFDAELCACAEACQGTTVPVTAHPAGAGPCGAEQLAGNVWEWVGGADVGGWGAVRGGSYLDYGWGVRAARSLPADRRLRTLNTGFRIAVDLKEEHDRA
jgi:formylglycine-generating enzyme required for sulfatase activity